MHSLRHQQWPGWPPEWVGADAVSYTTFNWDLGAAYDSVRTTYDSMVGPGEFDRMVSEQSDKLPFDIKEDVVDAFSGKIQVATYPVANMAAALEDSLEGGGAASAAQPVVFGLGLNDSRGLSELMDLALDGSGGMLKSRDFRGTPIYEGENPADGSAIAAAISGDTLLITTVVPRLESALRGPADDPMVEAPAFKEALSKMPAEVSMLSFTDQRSQAETVWGLLRSGEMSGTMDPEMAELFDEFAEALPPFEAVQPYLGISAGYMVPDEHGALWVSFGLETEDE
ncbi:MAG: hypothetical protein AAF907_06220 [Planctomycetota bacterium]